MLAAANAAPTVRAAGSGDRLVSDGSRNLPWMNLAAVLAPGADTYNTTDSVLSRINNLIASPSCARYLSFEPRFVNAESSVSAPARCPCPRDAHPRVRCAQVSSLQGSKEKIPVLRLRDASAKNPTKILINSGIRAPPL